MSAPRIFYNSDMVFGVAHKPSRRLSRPNVQRKYLIEQLQSAAIDEQTRKRLQRSLTRVERELERCSHVQWTLGDRDILRTVDSLGYASVDQVVSRMRLDPNCARRSLSRRGIANRMKLMFAHAWLDRPALQRALLYEHNASLIYCVGPAGTRVLAEHFGKCGRSAKRAAVPLTLAHELEVNDAMLSIEAAVRAVGLTFLDQDDLVVPVVESAKLSIPHPFGTKVVVTPPHLDQSIQLTAIPDRAFAVLHPDGARHTFLLEWDRETMSIGNKQTRLVGKSSFIKKLFSYHAIWQQKLHESRWGVTRWRLLTVTASDKRIASMLKAQHCVTGGRLAGLFLYTTAQRLAEHGPLGPVWISAAGDGIRLLESSSRSPVSAGA